MTVSRVSGVGHKMPAPSEEILERMARCAHRATESFLYDTRQQQEVAEWEEIREHDRDLWIVVARACYASLACNAGAEVKTVKENPS